MLNYCMYGACEITALVVLCEESAKLAVMHMCVRMQKQGFERSTHTLRSKRPLISI